MINKGKNILKTVNEQKLPIRIVVFLVGCFIVTLNYNMFLVKHNIVMGGFSGLAIIFKQLFGWNIPTFLNISTIGLVILSFIFLTPKKAVTTFLGSLCYNYMVALTAPLAVYLNIEFTSTFIMLVVASVVYGVSFGLIYRTGFNTGGSDTILAIMNKYLKIPMGLAGNWFNIFIILAGLIVFGPTNTIYALVILFAGNKITDNVTLGVKDSKMCFIKSKKSEEIEEYLLNKLKLGVTEMSSKGGVFTKKEAVLLVIVPTDEYYGFKHLIKKFDAESFILTTNCYAVKGGYKKQLIPF